MNGMRTLSPPATNSTCLPMHIHGRRHIHYSASPECSDTLTASRWDTGRGGKLRDRGVRPVNLTCRSGSRTPRRVFSDSLGVRIHIP
jgi:hypothetical protein